MASAPPSYDEMMKQSASAPPDPSMGGYAPYPPLSNAPYPTNNPYPANPPYPTGNYPSMPFPENTQMMPQINQPMPGQYHYPPQGPGIPQPGYTQTIVYSSNSQRKNFSLFLKKISLTSFFQFSALGSQPGAQEGGVIIHQVVTPISFSSYSMGVNCPSCQKYVSTAVKREITCGTHLCALLLLLFFWPLCWIPYCMNVFKR